MRKHFGHKIRPKASCRNSWPFYIFEHYPQIKNYSIINYRLKTNKCSYIMNTNKRSAKVVLSMKGLFQRSIESKEKIIIFYIDKNNQVTQRFIRIISMYDNSIVAFCYWRKQIRTFKLENILSAGPVRKKVGA